MGHGPCHSQLDGSWALPSVLWLPSELDTSVSFEAGKAQVWCGPQSAYKVSTVHC